MFRYFSYLVFLYIYFVTFRTWFYFVLLCYFLYLVNLRQPGARRQGSEKDGIFSSEPQEEEKKGKERSQSLEKKDYKVKKISTDQKKIKKQFKLCNILT